MERGNATVEDFFARDAWQAELAALRALLLGAGLDEALKWGQPCYSIDGGNVAILHRFKDCCAVGFVKGVLVPDPAGILTPPGENSRIGRVARVRSLEAIAAIEPALRTCLAEAVALERAGAKVVLPRDETPLPGELVAALDADPALAEAFAGLTPGRRRGYVLHIGQAKASATRAGRVDRCRAMILAGRGFDGR